MKKRFYIIIVFLIALGIIGYFYSESNSETPTEVKSIQKNTTELTEESESEAAPHKIVLGEFTLDSLNSTINEEWFENNYKLSTPQTKVLDSIKTLLQDKEFKIKIYMGMWCADSQREVPYLYKILDKVGFDRDNVSLVGVDEDKVVPEISDEKRQELNIINVPTIIVFDNEGNEINRIVEFPQETLEEDLYKIMSGQEYKHVYDF